MNFLLYNIIFKHNSSTFNIISNINILVLYWIVIFSNYFSIRFSIVKANRCALFFSFFVQHQKSEFRHKQINLLRPSAYIIFADMKETSALIDKACRNLNIDSLNGMQKQMLETATRPNDIILLSPTGSGKTLAFLLPVLSRISPKIAGVQALVIVPSRELALQIDNVLRKIAAGIKIVCCYGGHSVREESKSLAVAPALIVGTPGRIADHIRRGRIVLETLDTLVLDEFDKCLALGFQDEMQEIIAPLKNVKKKILTSATDSESLPAFTALKNR